MYKVMFMQNCFCPDQNQFNRLKNSIQSLFEYSKMVKTNNKYCYYLSGYISTEFIEDFKKLMDNFKSINDLFFDSIHVELNANNIGKGKVCNKTISKHGANYDYLFLFDNDIVFKPNTDDIVDILIKQQLELNEIGKMKYPIISCNFEDHQVHALDVLDHGIKTKDGRLVKCSTGRFGCLGGGCWLVEKSHWDEVGGYYSDSVYGVEDGRLYVDTLNLGIVYYH